jgi:hypothetical protein
VYAVPDDYQARNRSGSEGCCQAELSLGVHLAEHQLAQKSITTIPFFAVASTVAIVPPSTAGAAR